MAKKKKAAPRSAFEIAQELLGVREEKNKLAAIDKALTTELKERIKAGEEQDSFKIISENKLTIKDRDRVLEWAEKEAPHSITVDMKVARSIIMRQFTLPAGFEVKVSEKLVSMESSNEEEE